MRVVLDTNVIVSALLPPAGKTTDFVKRVSRQERTVKTDAP